MARCPLHCVQDPFDVKTREEGINGAVPSVLLPHLEFSLVPSRITLETPAHAPDKWCPRWRLRGRFWGPIRAHRGVPTVHLAVLLHQTLKTHAKVVVLRDWASSIELHHMFFGLAFPPKRSRSALVSNQTMCGINACVRTAGSSIGVYAIRRLVHVPRWAT